MTLSAMVKGRWCDKRDTDSEAARIASSAVLGKRRMCQFPSLCVASAFFAESRSEAMRQESGPRACQMVE
jgi:hypothetical protein